MNVRTGFVTQEIAQKLNCCEHNNESLGSPKAMNFLRSVAHA